MDDPVETPVPPITSSPSSPPVITEPSVEVPTLPSSSETLEQTCSSLVPNMPAKKVYPTRHHTAVQRYQPTLFCS